ncbi:amidohydrolase family protein [Taklimakanibacter lacteus]|uniref:amidohydrolase family protein n=1 Tax=Taklimakanibacter lacteus TaxID=2268456 RepID=UPI000E6726FC
MIVDSHVHVWSSDPQAYPWQPLLAHVPPPTYAAPVERLIADMAHARVDKAILVQPSVYGRDHRYLIDCLKLAPDRFIGVGLVDLRSATPREDFLDLIAKGAGRGLRLNTIRRGDVTRLTGPDYRDLFETAEEKGISIAFQMDIEQAPVVAQLAAQHRALPLIVDYLGPEIHGRSDSAPYLDLLAAQPNVHFKLLCTAEDTKSAYPFADVVAFYRSVFARFGAERVMFGSDYPGAANICSYDKLIQWGADFPGLGTAEKALVMGGTAARLFGISAEKT